MIPYFSHIIFFIIQYIQNTFGSFQSGVFQIIENFLIQLFCTSIASCILARLVAVRWNAFAATTSSLISWLSECNIDYQTWRQLGKSPAIINKNKSIKIDVFLLSCSSNYIKQISSFRTLSFFIIWSLCHLFRKPMRWDQFVTRPYNDLETSIFRR